MKINIETEQNPEIFCIRQIQFDQIMQILDEAMA